MKMKFLNEIGAESRCRIPLNFPALNRYAIIMYTALNVIANIIAIISKTVFSGIRDVLWLTIVSIIVTNVLISITLNIFFCP